MRLDKPSEAWLSGARTSPKYRRMGVATAMVMRCLEYAKERQVQVVRLATESNNRAAIATAQKMGFKPVAEYLEMVLENNVIHERSKFSKFAEKSQTEALWRYLSCSEIYRTAAGLYTVLYHWYSLDKKSLRSFVEHGEAIVCKNAEGEISGLTLIDDEASRVWHENTVQTCYIDGSFETVMDMIKFLKSQCRGRGIKKIYGYTCNYEPIVTAMKELGFKYPEKPTIVYERRIRT
ncbi:MAG: GNAT family N-acetyltransferase [Candidatus Bathyarchaeia archaeon]